MRLEKQQGARTQPPLTRTPALTLYPAARSCCTTLLPVLPVDPATNTWGGNRRGAAMHVAASASSAWRWHTLLLCPHAIKHHQTSSSQHTTYSCDLGRLICQGRLQARQRQQLTPYDNSQQQAPAVQHLLLSAAGRGVGSVPADSLAGTTMPAGAGAWAGAGAEQLSVGQPGSVVGVHCCGCVSSSG